ncbi:hypothetical protein Ahy_B09g099507 isoform A [Arachis hypogaea]|uniref:Uncharacterized protein n=1 Tax=Arachis hypogaea TaxID=3818 RepID=A0A444XTZ3_ARAHY|nr:hypothetical protein Ahy_B09g099507 isoform A [Arachis hypogaea]
MDFGSKESVISAIKSYTISREVDYTGYGAGCDWLIQASLIRKKGCWEIRRYNGKHMCTKGTISQDHAKLDSDTIADAIRLLVEADPLIKVKSIIAEVQSRFNYTTLLVWLKAMTAKMSRHIGCNFLRRFKTPYLHKLMVNTGNIIVNPFDRRNELFEAHEMKDCSIYTRLPYHHVLACYANQRLDWQVYVHDAYKMSEICKVYRGEFVPMGDPSTWDRYEGAKVIANWTLRRTTKGRPKSTCYLNEMDSRDIRGPRGVLYVDGRDIVVADVLSAQVQDLPEVNSG